MCQTLGSVVTAHRETAPAFRRLLVLNSVLLFFISRSLKIPLNVSVIWVWLGFAEIRNNSLLNEHALKCVLPKSSRDLRLPK